VDDDTRVARVNAAYVEKVPGFRVAGEAHQAAEALRLLETLPHVDKTNCTIWSEFMR
jgi:two-component system CitB family response regulator